MAVDLSPAVRTRFHIASLDGMRAIAVLIVFIGHGSTVDSVFPGHAGVTIFFFLSGYLIVSLLRRELEGSGRIALRNFYLRRALRILPPAYLAILCSISLGASGLISANVTIWGIAAEALSYTNYYIVLAGRGGLPPETTQFWSLGVEEHFYLIIPALILFLFRRKVKVRQIGWVLLFLATVVPIWRIYLGLNGAGFDRLYVSTDTRIDSMLYGSAFALLWNPAFGDRSPAVLRGRTLPYLATIGVFAFMITALMPTHSFRLGIADVFQCLSLVPIFTYIVSRPASVVGKILNSRPVIRLGVLSFSIYLFHKMTYALVEKLINESILADLVTFAITIIIAEFVHRFVERPLGRLQVRLHEQPEGK